MWSALTTWGMSKWMAADALRLIDRDFACLTQSDVPVLPPQNVKVTYLATTPTSKRVAHQDCAVLSARVTSAAAVSPELATAVSAAVPAVTPSTGEISPVATSALGLMSAGTLSGLALSAVVASAGMLSARELSDLALSAEAVSAGSLSLMGFSTRHCLWWQ